MGSGAFSFGGADGSENIGRRHACRGNGPPRQSREAEVGVALFVASYSALRKAPVSPALLAIKPLRSLTEPLININELHWLAGIAVIFFIFSALL